MTTLFDLIKKKWLYEELKKRVGSDKEAQFEKEIEELCKQVTISIVEPFKEAVSKPK